MALTPVDLRTDLRHAPVGLDSERPELAWRLETGTSADLGQVAYEVQVSDRGTFDGALTWSTGRVDGAEPFGIRYGGSILLPRRTYTWRVRVWAEGSDCPGPWSEPTTFETGMLQDSWQARWVSGDAPKRPDDFTALYLRGAAQLDSDVVRGRAYVSALGWYRFFVNGHDLTGPALVPRWTPFDDYVEYQVYDVTQAFRTGANIMAVAVGDGRFRGRLGLLNLQAVYGDRLAALVEVHLDLADGRSVVLTSDASWAAGPGRILRADPKTGEVVDLRISDQDWLSDPSPPARFSPAEVVQTQRCLLAEEVDRVQEVDRIPARSVSRTASGKQVVDFGQNFAGVVRIRLPGRAGAVVRLTHSEVLGADGELDLEYIQAPTTRDWYQRDEVVLADVPEWYEPWFTIHGFRYLEVDGLSEDLHPTDVEGVVLSSALTASGDFSCSHAGLTQLHRNVEWSLRSNFVDTATDCPTRERSGWTGDIQVFGATSTTLVDSHAYLRRYLRNVAVEQLPDGRVPHIIPAELSDFRGGSLAHRAASAGMARLVSALAGSVGWGDVSVLLPWTLYRYYGDRAVLERQYSSMTAWVDGLAHRARHQSSMKNRLLGRTGSETGQHLLDTGYHWGEWLRPGEDPVRCIVDSTTRRHTAVVATAYMEHSARRLSEVAEVLGRTSDARRYLDLADRTRAAWRATFLRPDGTIGSDRQDDYVRALAFGLLEAAERPGAVDRLVSMIGGQGDHLGTGFLSTPLLLDVLVDGGRADVAWTLLLQTSSPSWLHQVERGATTLWETWEGHKTDGRATDSHNHYAFGTVAGFLTEKVAGLAPGAPGYRVIDVRPLIGGGLTSARASVMTPYGRAVTAWRTVGTEVEVAVTAPPGTSARLTVVGATETLPAGIHTRRFPLAPAGGLGS